MYQVVNPTECRRAESYSALYTILKIMVYILSAVSVVFLVIDIIVIATSLDPSFLIPFLLAISIFSVKILNLAGLYMSICGGIQYKTIANILLCIGLVIIALAEFVIILEILALSKNAMYVLTDSFVLYFSFFLATDITALIYNSSVEVKSRKPYWMVPDNEIIVQCVEAYTLPVATRDNY